GDTDLILNIPPEDIPRLRKDARFAVESIATARALYIMINLKKKPFDDVRVRQALNHAINREAIVKSLFQNNAEAISGIVAPLQNGYAKLPGYAYDPKKAKELLAQAGVPALKVKLWSPKGRYIKDFELAHEVQQIVIKEAPAIFLISPNMIVGATKKVHGVVNLPLELTYLTEKSWKEK